MNVQSSIGVTAARWTVSGFQFDRIMRIFLATLLLCGSSMAEEIRVRKHVDDVLPDEWKTLAAAIMQLRAADKIGPLGPAINDPHPQSHDSYEWFVQIHGRLDEGGACKHLSELIWPWHRAFLLHFENRLRATTVPGAATITLPYWDWTDAPSGIHGYPAAYEDSGSALFHARTLYGKDVPLIVASNRIPLGQTPKEFVEDKLAFNAWADFGGTEDGPDAIAGALEAELHNQIHGYIGKDNANTVHAVRDPIFWAHHANLDRLWAEWQTRHATSAQCVACDAVVYDRDSGLGPLTFRALLDNGALPGGVRVTYAPKGQRSGPGIETADLGGGVQRANMAPVLHSLTMPALNGGRVRLRLHRVSIPSTTSYHISAYLFPSTVRYQDDADFDRRYKIAAIGVFASGHGQHHGPRDFSVDVTQAFLRVAPADIGRKWTLILRFGVTGADQAVGGPAEHDQTIGGVALERYDFATTQLLVFDKRSEP